MADSKLATTDVPFGDTKDGFRSMRYPNRVSWGKSCCMAMVNTMKDRAPLFNNMHIRMGNVFEGAETEAVTIEAL
jgi:hypothetical protein